MSLFGFDPVENVDESVGLCLRILDKAVELSGGSLREGQVAMAHHVALAFAEGNHLMVEAGTGIGKSFAYLAACCAFRRRVVVSTSSLALQSQLLEKDLPIVAEAARACGVELSFGLLKGRSNYLCLSALNELSSVPIGSSADIELLRGFADSSLAGGSDGDRRSAPVVSSDSWGLVSVSASQCAGPSCVSYDSCFAERARVNAREVDILVVNHHLLGFHLRYDGVFGEVDAFVVDEAHDLEEAVTSSLSLSLSKFRLSYAARLVEPFDKFSAKTLWLLSDEFDSVFSPFEGPLDSVGPLVPFVSKCISALAEAHSVLGARKDDAKSSAGAVAYNTVVGLGEDFSLFLRTDFALVRSVEVQGRKGQGSVRVNIAPLSVRSLLASKLFGSERTVLTSATLRVGGSFGSTGFMVGAPANTVTEVVTTPFFFEEQAALFVPESMPHPTKERAEFESVSDDILLELLAASGGRALVLSTSRVRVDAMAALCERETNFKVLRQGDFSSEALIAEFAADESSCLFATLSFWQGVDVPGSACSLVVLDRLPFPHFNDPLVRARIAAADAAGRDGFGMIAVPRAARVFAQGAGRLIRRVDDFGVVACLDSRLLDNWLHFKTIYESLPGMPVFRDVGDVAEFFDRFG